MAEQRSTAAPTSLQHPPRQKWPEQASEIAYRRFIDTVAAMVPGGVAPVTLKIREQLAQWGPGRCSVDATRNGLGLP